MKKILYIVAAVIALGAVAACTDDDNNKTTWEQYADWRQTNITWLEQQQARTNPDGTYEVNCYCIVSESAASKARIRAAENALKESEAAQKYADKIAGFVREGF